MLILKGLEGNIIPPQIAALQDYASLPEPKRAGTPVLGQEEFVKQKSGSRAAAFQVLAMIPDAYSIILVSEVKLFLDQRCADDIAAREFGSALIAALILRHYI